MPVKTIADGRRIEKLWIMPSFMDALDQRKRERTLLNGLFACVETLQANPRHPSLNFERLGGRDEHGVWSARINDKYRLILAEVARDEAGLLHFDNHDEAYAWADRHSRSIASAIARAVAMPRGWRGEPIAFPRSDAEAPRAVADVAAIQRMLEHGMWRYMSYLDEHQSHLATREMNGRSGPTLIYGGAGTGKTALALTRVKHLASRPEMDRGRVLYLCFGHVLATTVESLLKSEYGGRYPTDQIEVSTIHNWCSRYLRMRGFVPEIPSNDNWYTAHLRRLIEASSVMRERLGSLTVEDVAREIKLVLHTNDFASEDEYRAVNRRGMGQRLTMAQRSAIWDIYADAMGARNEITFGEMLVLALRSLRDDANLMPYRGIVIDEAQDCSPVMLRIAKELVGGDDRRLFVLADIAQSIFPNGFYWAQQELKSRASILKKTYRTTRQVDALARSLYGSDDEMRKSLDDSWPPTREGPLPVLLACTSAKQQATEIAEHVAAAIAGGSLPEHIAVLAPAWAELEDIRAALVERSVPVSLMSRDARTLDLNQRTVKLLTIHSAKGLDFPNVYVAGLTNTRLSRKTDSERRALLYVGMTRSSFALTLGTVVQDAHDIVFDLPTTAYDLAGDAVAKLRVDVRYRAL